MRALQTTDGERNRMKVLVRESGSSVMILITREDTRIECQRRLVTYTVMPSPSQSERQPKSGVVVIDEKRGATLSSREIWKRSSRKYYPREGGRRKTLSRDVGTVRPVYTGFTQLGCGRKCDREMHCVGQRTALRRIQLKPSDPA